LADVTLSLVDLAAIDSAHADGGVFEKGGGRYRLDLPDTLAIPVTVISLHAEAEDKRLIAPLIQVVAAVAGSGPYVVTVTVTDDDEAPLQNVTVRLAEGVNEFVVVTDADGEAVFSLAAATYAVTLSKSGYSFAPATLVVDEAT